jgi:hypothetical protein
MVSEKKINFLIKQGFDKNAISVLIECGVEKHIVWFLTMHKNGSIKDFNANDIKTINLYLTSKASDRSDKVEKLRKDTYSSTLILARKFERTQNRKEKNKIYRFKNGFYISMLNSIDLKEEGQAMSNCVGSYEERVSIGAVGLLALKQPSGKTVAHIEIKKNGLIGQNYSKANSQIIKEYWMMILEFFENNSKTVDLSLAFGESYVATCQGGNVEQIILSVPTSVNVFLDNGIKKSDQIHGFEVKRFIPFYKQQESAFKISSQSEIANWIEQKKQEVIKSYDELITQIVSTAASKLFLSDSIKEIIFGQSKNAYLMKGENYNLSEIDPGNGSNEYLEGEEMDLEVGYENPVPMPMEVAPDERVAIARRPEIQEMPRNNDPQAMEGDIELDGGMRAQARRNVAILLQRRRRNVVVEDDLQNVENQINENDGLKEMEMELAFENEIIEKREEFDAPVVEMPYLGDEGEKEEVAIAVGMAEAGGVGEEYDAIVEDVNGDIYGVVEGAEGGGMGEEEPLPGYFGAPEPFEEIMRRAVRK